MRPITWSSTILSPVLVLGLLTARAEENPATAPAPNPPPTLAPPPANPPPPFLSEEGKQKFLSAPSLLVTSSTAIAVTDAATAPPAKSTVRRELSSMIRRAFPYAPPAVAMAASTPPNSDIVEMKPFHVTGTNIAERAERGMEEKAQKLKDEAFKFKEGGTIKRFGDRAELQLKYNPLHKGWDILDIHF